jgi:NADPH2:quinone reductase
VRAVVVDHWMKPSQLRVSDVPEPAVRPGAVKIATRAAALNFFDTLIVQGRYQVRPPFPFVPGGELAGEIVELGEGVRDRHVGDRVLASGLLGGFAERVVVGEADCIPVPRDMGFAEAAALPIVYGTSYAALVFRAGLQRGETLLVHAAAGGVGLAAVQIGKALGARVIATAGGPEKIAVAREHGADLGIDYRAEDFVPRVREATDDRGADVIYDPVGGDVFERSLKCIAWNGRLLVIGFASGDIPSVKLNRVMLKNISLVGCHWPGYATAEPERVREAYDGLFRLYGEGRIRPVVSARYALEDLPEALEALGSRGTVGKVVVEP